MKVISWNTRGLGSKKKRNLVKEFLEVQDPEVVMLQETKRESWNRRFLGSIWRGRDRDWADLGGGGGGGGGVGVVIGIQLSLFVPRRC